MPLEYIAKFAALLACFIILSFHLVVIAPPKNFHPSTTFEHRCAACAYTLFAVHYLYEFVPHMA